LSDPETVRIELTPEQREVIHRLSGQHIDAIELERAELSPLESPPQLRWRLSAASGIPRQAWTMIADELAPPPSPSDETKSG
jgi:hypothetical protein